MRKLFLPLAGLMILAVLLAACGSPSGVETVEVVVTEIVEVEVPTEGEVQVVNAPGYRPARLRISGC